MWVEHHVLNEWINEWTVRSDPCPVLSLACLHHSPIYTTSSMKLFLVFPVGSYLFNRLKKQSFMICTSIFYN